MRQVLNRGEHGQAGVMMVLSLTFLFGVMGLSVDLGRFYYQKQMAQAAADAGATAAAAYATDNPATSELVVTGKACGNAAITSGSAPYVGCQYATAAANGSFPNADVTMTSANSVPTNAPGTPSTYWVQTTVSESLNSSFLRFFGHNSVTVSAEATAGIVASAAVANPYCLMALATSTTEAFFASGSNSGPTLDNCGIAVNSTANSNSNANNNAYVLNGSATVTLDGTGGKINVVGGANVNGTYCSTPSLTCNTTAATDPLATLPAPTVGACPTSPAIGYQQYNVSSGSPTLNPGVYCGGISIGGSAAVTLNPGTYILLGGGLTVNSANASLTGSGVTFYNAGNSTYIIGPVVISGQPSVTLSAPTTGTYKGILFFQEPHTTYSTTNQFNGASSPNITGTLYFAGSPVQYTGSSSTPTYTAIIAQTITFNGNYSAYFKWDSSGQYTGLQPGPSANLLQ